jgi:hypothetical protein
MSFRKIQNHVLVRASLADQNFLSKAVAELLLYTLRPLC